MPLATRVAEYLEREGEGYHLVTHPRTGSSRESAEAAEVPDDHIAKAVVLKDPAGPVLVVIPADGWVRLHAVQAELDRPLQLSDEHHAEILFSDCRPGAIPPFGHLYNLETLLDEALLSLASVWFEAGDHENLVEVSGDAFMRLMDGARRGHFCYSE